MKRRMLAALVCLLISLCAGARAEEGQAPPALYVGIAQQSVSLRAEPSMDAEVIGRYVKGAAVHITAYEPAWLTAVGHFGGETVVGYLPRHTVSEVRTLSEAAFPYGATPSLYTALLANDTLLRDAPFSTADPLITLPKDAKVAILSIDNGWAKVIYWRQYGYFSVDAIKNLAPVYPAETALPGDTLGAFVSFYNLVQTEINLNRIKNIVQCSSDIRVTVQPGKRFVFDTVAGPYWTSRGYYPAPAFYNGQEVLSNGGGVCQVSSTLYNVLLALPKGLTVEYRRSHGMSGAAYLPHGVDSAVGGENLDLIFRNAYDFPVRIDACALGGVLYVAVIREEGGL